MSESVIIVCDSLRVGGIQKALIGFLEVLAAKDYDVEVFFFDDSCNVESLEHERVRVLPSIDRLRVCGTTFHLASQRGASFKLKRFIYSMSCRILGSRRTCSVLFSGIKIQKSYDIAISFCNDLGPRSPYFGSNQFVLDCVDAKRKITWIHVDPDMFDIDTRENIDIYSRFHGIACVSEYVKFRFQSYFPDLAHKCFVVSNYVNKKTLETQSYDSISETLENKFKIITVGRLEEMKNQIIIPMILRQLKDRGIEAIWLLLGDGPEHEKIKQAAACEGVEDSLLILGEKCNPYPYLVRSDLFVSVSKTESFGLSIAESLALGTPVIALYYPAINEIEKCSTGLTVVRNQDEIASAIEAFITRDGEYEASLLINANKVHSQFERLVNGC